MARRLAAIERTSSQAHQAVHIGSGVLLHDHDNLYRLPRYRIHYDLWKLESRNVEAVSVGKRQFTDPSSIAQIVAALKASEWYSVDHGGWGDETSIVLKMKSGKKWQMRAGYHFAQQGAVVLRSSGPRGRGWDFGQVFSPALPNVLDQLGAPLSHCGTAHGHPCKSLQQPRRSQLGS